MYDNVTDSRVARLTADVGQFFPSVPRLIAKRIGRRALRVLIRLDGLHSATYMVSRAPPKADPDRESADELLFERIVEEAGHAVREAIRDHKRTGHPIAEWKDGRVVLTPPDQIED